MPAGVNHLAFHVETLAELALLVTAAPDHRWRLMFPEKHPNAGGSNHLAGYLENEDGFEVELVASATTEQSSGTPY